ncbi:MAG: preprotein translocase subunit YajC [SAR324 cluster bacterium]|uniref:Preprotein translocase subunit YajC n=1 Tax=SAR324 cluster bacterium TaxID=2024889 RepID=A0A7X9IKT2_9DELT|nr:preprotein translocase subunit YajC [SAR324 cluster bacterium]
MRGTLVIQPLKKALLLAPILTTLFWVNDLFAQAAPAQVKRPGFGELLGNLFPLIIMVFFIFYFMVTRPQQQRQKALEDLHKELKKGDLVMTTSGIIARVSGIESDCFLLEIASGVKVKFEKSSVTRKLEKIASSKSEANKE